jgi:hypothetical protein
LAVRGDSTRSARIRSVSSRAVGLKWKAMPTANFGARGRLDPASPLRRIRLILPASPRRGGSRSA